jgi:hypothetical protein
MLRVRSVALGLVLLLAGCGRGAGTRCERICRAESDCAEKLQLDGDTNGCIEACSALERDPATLRLVDEHARCVLSAPTCDAMLDCA